MKKIDNIKEYETKKQSSDYLSKIYSLERRPFSNYPTKLANYVYQKIIKKNFEVSGKIKFLEVGCGRGDMLKEFNKFENFSCYGIDLSNESIEYCKPIPVHQVNLEDENFNYNEGNFDVIFSKSLIEHLKNPLIYIKSCQKLLKKNGILIILTPSWYHHSFGPFYLDHTHCTPFTLNSLIDIGLLANFSETDVNYFYQLPSIWKFPYLKFIPKFISFLKLPYLPMYEKMTIIKWPQFINKYIRFSREVMLIGVFKK